MLNIVAGCDLEEFIKYTLVKNAADRRRLLQIEQELINFIKDPNRKDLQFPRMSSYNRMLVHRTVSALLIYLASILASILHY